MKVVFCIWNNPKDESVLKNIEKLFKDKVSPTLDFEIHNVSAYGELETDNPCVIFGSKVKSQITTTGDSVVVADTEKLIKADENRPYRVKTAGILNKFFADLRKKLYDEKGYDTKKFAEEKKKQKKEEQSNILEINGVKIGEGPTADIQLTEKQAGYLQKLKDLFGGGKMVVENNGKRVEV